MTETMTVATHDALDALLALHDEQGTLTAAEVADQALTHDLDEAEAEALAHELEQHGIVPEVEEEDAPELAGRIVASDHQHPDHDTEAWPVEEAGP